MPRHNGPLEIRYAKNDRLGEMASWILEVHGPEALADWCLARVELGLHHGKEQTKMMTWVRRCQSEMFVELQEISRLMTLSTVRLQQIQREEQRESEADWQRRRAEIIRRDEKRRRGSLRQHFEKCKAKPAAKERPLSTAERMSRAWSRRYMQQRRQLEMV